MKKKKKKYNLGGFSDITGLATTPLNALVPGLGTGVNMAAGLVDMFTAPDPSDYQPLRYNNSTYGRYRGGAMPDNAAAASQDTALAQDAFEVNGSPGIDTNPRNVGGQDVLLTEGEVVEQMNNDQAYVHSNAPDMPHPKTGKTFADTVKPLMKAKDKIERRSKTRPNDPLFKRSLAVINSMIDDNRTLEAQARAERGASVEGDQMYLGGYKRYYKGGVIKRNTGGDVDFYDRFTGGMNANQRIAGTPNQGFNSTAPTDTTGGFNMSGDDFYTGTKVLEGSLKAFQNFQPAQEYDARRYQIDPYKINPTDQFRRNQLTYQSAKQGIQTGNASLDRAVLNNLYTQRLESDRRIGSDTAVKNRQIAQQTAAANAQALAQVDQINDQNAAASRRAQASSYTDIGTIGQIFQDRANTRKRNDISLASLNQLSSYYKIDPEELQRIMDNDPAKFEQLLFQFKGQG